MRRPLSSKGRWLAVSELLWLLSWVGTLRLVAATYYVSPAGSDANAGTRAKPFATVQKAQEEARRASARSETVTVILREGTHYLATPLVFSSLDSGSREHPVNYRAEAGEQPVLSGGQWLRLNWEVWRDGIMKATVPPGLETDQLFVNGQRQILARYPNDDPKASHLRGFDPGAFGPARASRWAHPEGGFIHAIHAHEWGDFHYRITGKSATGVVEFEGGWQNNRRMGMHPKYRMVENLLEELDAPEEWFLERATRTLYFFPPHGLDLAGATMVAARLPQLVEFRGRADRPVRFITLRGLTFRHTTRTFMENREPLLRSDWTIHRGGAVYLTGTEDCALETVLIDQPGGNAVFVDGYNRRVRIASSHIRGAGANGIAFVGRPTAVRNPLFEYNQRQRLGAIDRTPGPKSPDYPADSLVEDCLIHETGRVEKQSAPIQIAMAMGITVRHCSLYDVPRAGINIGDGCWGGHVIEFCDIFDTVQETGDHGSFNSWGRDRYWELGDADPNTLMLGENKDLPFLDAVRPVILRNNRWRCDHGWDIDLDDGSSHYEIRNNLCLHGGIKLREGFGRVCENNIMVGNSFHPHVWFHHSQDVFRRNIVFTPYQPIRVDKPWGSECDFNLLHEVARTNAEPAGVLQSQSGLDAHSLHADAAFLNPARGDYRVRVTSPARELGFVNFPMDQFGVQSRKLKSLARTPRLPAALNEARGTESSGRDATAVPWHGATVRNIVGPGEVSAHGLPGETGVLILQVPPGSVVAKSGLRPIDVILRANGHVVGTVEDLLRIGNSTPGDEALELDVYRRQGHVTVRLGPGHTPVKP